MKCNLYQRIISMFLVLVTLVSLAEFLPQVEAAGSSVDFLYTMGMWKGKKSGTYKGGLSNGEPSGQGTLSFTYGGTYSGEFTFGNPSGKGTYTYDNGEYASGTFSWTGGMNFLIARSDRSGDPFYEGTEATYEGMIMDGYPCGFGTLDFADGGTFYGEFWNGTIDGKGVYVYLEPNDEESISGRNWTFVSRMDSTKLAGRWYSGLMLGNTWEGYGMVCYNYSYYIGEFRNYYCSGHGTFWEWAKKGDPSETMTMKDYGHYKKGKMAYACTHESGEVKYGIAPIGGTSTHGTTDEQTTGSTGNIQRCTHCNAGFCWECGGTGTRPCPRNCLNGKCQKCFGRGSYYLAGKERPCYCTSGNCNTCYGRGTLDCYHCDYGRCRYCGGDGIL